LAARRGTLDAGRLELRHIGQHQRVFGLWYASRASEANTAQPACSAIPAATISRAKPLLSAGHMRSPPWRARAVAAKPGGIPAKAATNTSPCMWPGARSKNGPREDNYVETPFRETLGVKGKWIEGLSVRLVWPGSASTPCTDIEGGVRQYHSALQAREVGSRHGPRKATCQSVINARIRIGRTWNIFAKGAS